MKRFAVLCGGVAVSCLAAAAMAAGGDAAHDSSAGAHGPSYGLLTVDGMAMVWSIVVFILLLLILRVVAWKPIQQALVQRERFIADSLAQARKEREEAERMLRQYTEQVHRAREEATAIVEEGKRDAEAVRKRIHEEARVEAHALVERAKRELAIARDDAIKSLYQQSVELASQMAGKLVRRELSPKDHEALLDEALTDLGQMRR